MEILILIVSFLTPIILIFNERYYLRSIGVFLIGFSFFALTYLRLDSIIFAMSGVLLALWPEAIYEFISKAIDGSYAGICGLLGAIVVTIIVYGNLFLQTKAKGENPINKQFLISSISVFSLFFSFWILVEIFVPIQLNLTAINQFNNQFCQLNKLSAIRIYINSLSRLKPNYNATLLAKDGRYNWSFRQAAWVHASYEWYAQGSNYTPNQILEQDLKSFKICMAKK